jgi:hypothetical protein
LQDQRKSIQASNIPIQHGFGSEYSENTQWYRDHCTCTATKEVMIKKKENPNNNTLIFPIDIGIVLPLMDKNSVLLSS